MSKIIMLVGLPGSGKGQPVNSVLPTPNGNKRIGDLKVGDYVFGKNGKPTKVIGVFPRGVLPVYKVSFTDGSSLVVDGDHIWTFEGRLSRNKDCRGERTTYNYTTRELYEKGGLRVNRGAKAKTIPICGALEYSGHLEIDPYILGLYLADGSCNNGCVRITKGEQSVIDYMMVLEDCPRVRHHYRGNTPYFTYGGKEERKPLKDYLEKVGLKDKKSKDKFIPEEVFYLNKEERLRFLRGIMDGDGTVRKRKNNRSRIAVYTSISERLVDDVARLVNSLGGCCKKSFHNHKGGGYWQVMIYTEFNPFLASEEVSEWKKPFFTIGKYRTLKSVEKCGFEQVVCIAVEAEDSLYIADTNYYIVTHNTTWAKEKVKTSGNYVRISKDDIREHIMGGYSPKKEKMVVKIRNQLIKTALQQGYSVIVDDTNLNPTHKRSISQIAREFGATFEVNNSFLDVSVEECVRRDLARPNSVGQNVIYEMYEKWVKKPITYKLDKEGDKRRCVIFDIDGTLAHNEKGRDIYDFSRVIEDTCDPFLGLIADCLNEVVGFSYLDIVIVSGREDTSRTETEEWLENNSIPFKKLLMRKEGDRRPDEIVKQEIYEQEIAPNWAVLGVFDDRPKVCRMWRDLGLNVLQAGNPYHEF